MITLWYQKKKELISKWAKLHKNELQTAVFHDRSADMYQITRRHIIEDVLIRDILEKKLISDSVHCNILSHISDYVANNCGYWIR
jgi:hypothetical protein